MLLGHICVICLISINIYIFITWSHEWLNLVKRPLNGGKTNERTCIVEQNHEIPNRKQQFIQWPNSLSGPREEGIEIVVQSVTRSVADCHNESAAIERWRWRAKIWYPWWFSLQWKAIWSRREGCRPFKIDQADTKSFGASRRNEKELLVLSYLKA